MNQQNQELARAIKQLQEIQGQLESTLKQARFRASVTQVVSVVVIVLLAAYFTIAYIQIARTDAEVAAYMLQNQVEQQLPAARLELQRHLIESAPDYVRQVELRMKEMPAELSGILQSILLAQLQQGVDELETQLYETMKEQLQLVYAEVTAERGNQALTEAEITDSIDRIVAEYARKSQDLMDDLYVRYLGFSDELIDYLYYLGKGEDLSPRETLHRNILQWFFAFMETVQFGELTMESLTSP